MELDEPSGKNDGSVNGVRYFECKPNHGLFSHPSKFIMYVIHFKDLAKNRFRATFSMKLV